MFICSYTEYVGFKESIGALLLAVDKIREKHLLDDYALKIIIRNDDCQEVEAIGKAVELVTKVNVDVIIGPTCNAPAVAVSVMSSYFNVPNYVWGLTTTNELALDKRSSTVTSLAANYISLGMAVVAVMQHFEWNEFAFVYSSTEDEQKCNILLTDIERVIYNNPVVTVTTTADVKSASANDTRTALQDVSGKARGAVSVIVVCLSKNANKRTFILTAKDENRLTDDYVYIFADLPSKFIKSIDLKNETEYVWEDQSNPPDGRDEEASEAFKRTFMLTDLDEDDISSASSVPFVDAVSKKMEDPLLSQLNSTVSNGWTIAQYAPGLHDAMIIYANALNRTLELGGDYKNGALIAKMSAGTHEGALSNVTIASNGLRLSDFVFNGLGSSNEVKRLLVIEMSNQGRNATVNPQYRPEEEDNVVWSGRTRPGTVPECGFVGVCYSFLGTYYLYVIIGGVIGGVLILTIIGTIIWAVRARHAEKARFNALWKIPFYELTATTVRRSRSQSFLSSDRSARTLDEGTKSENENVCYFYHGKDTYIGFKHMVAIKFDAKRNTEFGKMYQIVHDNLNRFAGITYNAGITYSLWRFCSRGSVQDVITKGSLPVDSIFVQSMLMDIAAICMVDERWQVKISLFGLTYIKEHETVKDEDLLWTAPEILRGDVDRIGYTEGDLYSFAIIGSEIITKKQAWDLDNRKETPRDIIRMVSKVSINPPRPEVDLSEVDDDVIRALVGLVRDCWSENPRHRPGIKNVTQLLRSMQTERKINLMDHVMNTLENYASELEVEVQERMKELVAEKKKSDLLLLRMLPKPVAEKLKAGECVQPESYNSVTVFFSDVVSFTTLASKCTPMQVVTLLNELYTFFDETISRHDVYKVETIGDGYLCASGVPIRNGLEHIREICNLALELVIGLKEFRVPHLPNECISIRVGIHSGSVVAGVVGLTMPRYCLFGDTVNTSSRMESNGKAGRIHLSADAKELLSKNYIGYHTRPRGDVLIKGKGVMSTHWLVGFGNQMILKEGEIYEDDRSVIDVSNVNIDSY
ncbi:hypothetical protein Q1695_003872 [Nippostrongylus brasiliensis]|nr:hypothetical protein Q1695_003872 [Nippostrongylus brasiliensis]